MIIMKYSICGCFSLNHDSNRKEKQQIHLHWMQKLILNCQSDMITFSQRCHMSANGGDVPNKTKPAKTIDQQQFRWGLGGVIFLFLSIFTVPDL